MEESLEWQRAVGPDVRDPRCDGPPCNGHHRAAAPGKGSCSGSNKWAKWVGCEVCQLRLQYVPRVGAPGHSDVSDVVQKEDVSPVDLTTRAIALHGAEKGLLDRLDEVQKHKAKIKERPIDLTVEKAGYPKAPAIASKKSTKREGEVPPEVQSWSVVSSPTPSPTPSA